MLSITLITQTNYCRIASLQVLLFPAMKPEAAEKAAADGVAALSIVSARGHLLLAGCWLAAGCRDAAWDLVTLPACGLVLRVLPTTQLPTTNRPPLNRHVPNPPPPPRSYLVRLFPQNEPSA